MDLSDHEREAFDEIVFPFEDGLCRSRGRRAFSASAAVLGVALIIVQVGFHWPWAAVGMFTTSFLFGLVGGLLLMATEALAGSGHGRRTVPRGRLLR